MDLNSNPLQFGVKMLRLKYVTNFLKKEYQAIYHSIYGILHMTEIQNLQ